MNNPYKLFGYRLTETGKALVGLLMATLALVIWAILWPSGFVVLYVIVTVVGDWWVFFLLMSSDEEFTDEIPASILEYFGIFLSLYVFFLVYGFCTKILPLLAERDPRKCKEKPDDTLRVKPDNYTELEEYAVNILDAYDGSEEYISTRTCIR